MFKEKSFSQLLTDIGEMYYDDHRNFTIFAGFLEGLMSSMFHDLAEDKKAYYLQRAKDKFTELALKNANEFSERVGEPL